MYLLMTGIYRDILWTSCVKPPTEDGLMKAETRLVIKKKASLEKLFVCYVKGTYTTLWTVLNSDLQLGV
jgi:hypothetical protein